MPRTTKTTLRQVADLAGVSTATVDRVLNGRGGVRDALEARVLSAARHLHMDRNLDHLPKQTLRFSILMNRPDRDVYARVEKAVLTHQALHADRQFICHFQHFASQAPEDIASRIASIRDVMDGALIIAYDHAAVKEALSGLTSEMPVVTLLSDLPDSGRIHYAGSGNLAAGRLAGDLMGRYIGDRSGRLLIISRLQRYTAHADREVGFRQVIEERYPHLQLGDQIECNRADEVDRRRLEQLVRRRGPYAGIYNISSWNFGLVEEIRKASGSGDCKLISHGVNRRTRDLLARGGLDTVIEYEPEEYVFQGLDALLHHYGRCPAFKPAVRHRLEVFTPEHLPPDIY